MMQWLRPPRLPDITPLDFFLWVYAENASKVTGLQNLKAYIRDAIPIVEQRNAGSNMA
jgi:hypothetical protein